MQLAVQCKKQFPSVALWWRFPPRCAFRVDGAKQAHGVRMLQARREVFPELDPLHVLAYLDNLGQNSSHLPLNYTAGSLGCIKP